VDRGPKLKLVTLEDEEELVGVLVLEVVVLVVEVGEVVVLELEVELLVVDFVVLEVVD